MRFFYNSPHVHDSERVRLVSGAFVWAYGVELSKGLQLLDGTRSLRNVESCFLVGFFFLPQSETRPGRIRQ